MRKLSLVLALPLFPLLLLFTGCGATASPAQPDDAAIAPDPEITATSAAESGGRPWAEFSESEIDLGIVPLNAWVEHRFILTNTGDADLHILGNVAIQLVAGC